MHVRHCSSEAVASYIYICYPQILCALLWSFHSAIDMRLTYIDTQFLSRNVQPFQCLVPLSIFVFWLYSTQLLYIY